MVRTQIIALSLGAAFAAAIGGVLIWEGLPGTQPQTSHESTPPGAVTEPSASTPAEKEAMGGAVKVPQSKSAPPAEASPAAPSKSASSAPGSTASGPASAASNPAPAAAASDSASKPAAIASQDAPSTPSQKEAPAKAASGSTPETVPQFDTVRVEPSGDSVVAGHGPANRKVALLAGNKVIGDAETEDSGDFVIVPEPLAPGNYVLSLRSGKLRSRQSVTVSVPAKGKKGLVVALDEPGKPSVLLADPTAPSAAAKPETTPAASAEAPAKPAPNAAPTVAFKTAEVDKGGFYASGFAPPGTHVRIYLNGSALADVTADSKGRWSLTIGKGMTAGHYVVRADALDAKGKVVARAQVPFDMPVAVAENDAPAAAAHKPATAPHEAAVASSSQPEALEQSSQAETPPASKPQTASESSDASHAVVAKVETAKVVHGDSLWRISRETLGHGIRYTLIYKANASQIRNPNLIYPGQVFVVPHVN